MSLPGLDSGAVLVKHAWEAAAPWQVSCEEGEMVYRVGEESEDGWVEKNWRSVQSAVGTGAKGLATGAKSLGAAAAAWGGMVAYHAAAPMGQVGGGVFGGFVGASAGAKVGEKIRKL